ncbi:DUF393 domain-containing protein [Luteolibacter sp. LG18]|uniref:thiol-disulfide oxidoreductase DCC family protein n=1 Tax=Luteolibacter sp. LG18 TaxID=2819286 RepID=UPI002B311622|nr:hypothetical protein llg_30380 [Luteolibacter sp. LG18]
MNTLTVFFDARCGLCCRFRRWLMTQPARVSIRFVPYNSEEALQLFPRIREVRADREVVVLADDGRWWQGPGAWLTCLWATRDYIAWSYRLAAPVFQPLVVKAVGLISENRLRLSTFLNLSTDDELEDFIRQTVTPDCDQGGCGLPPALPRVSFPEPLTPVDR